MKIKKTTLHEYMLFGSSPEKLKKLGSWDREEDYYNFLRNKYNVKIYSFPVYKGLISKFYGLIRSILIPIYFGIKDRYSGEKSCIRTKQFWGCWSAIIHAKLSNNKLCLRLGYVWSDAILKNYGTNKLFRSLILQFENFLLSKGDFYIFASNHIYKRFANVIKNKEYQIIPNGVNRDKFKQIKTKKIYDFIYIGRLIKIKGAAELINFIKLNKDLKFLLIGSVSEKYFKKLKLLDNVEHLEFVSNDKIPLYLNKSKAFVSFSQTEGSPKALIEAIACGLYPIVSGIDAYKFVLGEQYKNLECIKFNKKFNKDKFDKYCLKFNSVEIINKFDMEKLIEIELNFMLKFIL